MKELNIEIPLEGELFVPMTNDYLFKMLLQRNNLVLKELVQDLLHMEQGSIDTITITNPIHLGDSFNQKSIILDIEAILNDNSIVNLEMQVINEHDWPERSLYYACDEYQNLNKGDSYLNVKPVYQIGILNFTLFEDHPQFYSKYLMSNVENHLIYSDKFQIYVLDLKKIELATPEDKQYRLDMWAMMFRSTKWEELRMLAKDMPIIDEASKTIYEITAENESRLELRARQDAIRRANDREIYEQRLKDSIAEKEEKLAQMDSELAEKNAKIAELEKQLEELKSSK
ncbi:Rpn family recombination-promoting nuclease/putative transposase [Pseudobutyrivibrio sp.]|uniref:Rpn family recombination-promoting nuclease/putative transposase n=1 Tax=Pseudobutyrivibrio sp. TaxID=2014367 RepID=UPI001D9E01C8|nr:Rpn family recombination-promoting nuclease/putative transposase [Pseudobutyrivibrio sp.]MBE5910506.1 Rpn family recombination-promoting nuclease/putative transposase [Pseudobutyrivibrio sp.]